MYMQSWAINQQFTNTVVLVCSVQTFPSGLAYMIKVIVMILVTFTIFLPTPIQQQLCVIRAAEFPLKHLYVKTV